ncbi:MAG: lysophospholipid acyltransferase family protein [Proteobacteria bacterium]|nr:lysophospholipid acyltransferase family protein [Pseudomonadota bacterium]MBU1739566.1 lysophospholipid acyltransferase family protein [Pseudomonadota bacterium]
MPVMKNIFDRLALVLIPTLFKWLTRILFLTCRMNDPSWRVIEEFEAAGKPYIAAFWHYSIVFVVQRGHGRSILAMVSASKDGEYIARMVESMGFITARGSSNRRGVAALKEMVRIVGEKRISSTLIADGSQGPPRIAQAGSILLASKTGVPIIPIAAAADRYIAFKSWDRTVLPKPFSRIEFLCGEPIEVPPGIRSEQLEEYRLRLEESLNALYKKSWGKFGIAEH